MSAAITVLVPVRGQGAFLASALGSLRAQGFDRWQALLLASGDNACDRAMQLAAGDARTRVVDAGALELQALAIAADAVDTPFLCVLDGDDMLDAGALASLHAALAAAPDAGMAYSRHVLADATGRILGPGPLCEIPYSPDALLLDCMTGPLRLLRTDAFRRAGGYDPASGDAADYDLCLRLSEVAGVVHVPRPLYARRIHPQAPEVARWAGGIEARYRAFLAAVRRRGLDARYDTALEIDSWHILQPLQPAKPFGGVGRWS